MIAVPLVPRRRVAAVPHGAMRSLRRGPGFDLVGTRPYRPGDDVRRVDQRASARRSSQLGRDELLVRQYLTEDATLVVTLVDRRPAMTVVRGSAPGLAKPRAIAAAGRVVLESALAARCLPGYLDHASWIAPDGRAGPANVLQQLESPAGRASGSSLTEALLAALDLGSALPPTTFLFVVSDYLDPPAPELLLLCLARGWDLVPVVIQDPVWEQSFPLLGGVTLPITDPATGRTSLVRISRSDAQSRRTANEQRLERLLSGLAELGLDHVLVSTSDPIGVHAAFTAWAAGRRAGARAL
jgi:uncharacterized protein (DUF58 family)